VIHIGFTGTRYGMSREQASKVSQIVADLADDARGAGSSLVAHHGDCVGADSNFHGIAKFHGARMIGHPPTSTGSRSNRTFDETRPAMGHLARNRMIVGESTVVIATPFELEHQKRGGTWYTIDHTKRVNKPLVVVMRDGFAIVSGPAWPGTRSPS
jgi:hypothetical protein